MGDRFPLPVGWLLTESTLEAAIQSKNLSQRAPSTDVENTSSGISSHRLDINVGSSPRKLVECRICHDEDEDLNMEIPCSCRGSLKYVHRRCAQRWCNEKGNTICEICHQQFKPGFTAPPPLFHYGGIPLNLRENWYISGRDLQNPQFITVVSTEHNFMDPEYDEYSGYTPRSLICCRVVAIIFMLLLILRHTLPIIIYGAGDYSITLFTVLVLRAIGIVLPIYVMVKAFTVIRRRRHTDDEENELPLQQPQSRLGRVH
ncbi:PREDICTED: uncharacterized protein LOC109168414 isoform X2 [Ipomoea nil]|uniref:uncharacterized protein LOC109168414 isoform X2 n=1 Tax=Ipomoea nil TaxID=35883 RepID=UPI000900B85E|nr:PREDICTED: uncharacterized protein LOC109168414 isoform X2 [Ipomoea nil]